MKADRDHVVEQRVEHGLREILGDAVPPDLTQQVLDRFNAGDRAAPTPSSSPLNRWLTAAMVLLTVSITGVVYWLARDPATPADQAPVRQDPPPCVRTVAELAAVPAGTEALTCVGFTDRDLQGIVRLRNLRDLVVSAEPGSGKGLTDAAFETLKQLSKLVKLDLVNNIGITGRGLRLLRANPNLRELRLANTGLDDDGMAALSTLSGLRVLDIANNLRFGDASAGNLAALQWLQHLNISSCSQLTAKGLVRLAELTRLRSLDISYMYGLQRLSRFGDLPHEGDDKGVTDAVLEALSGLPHLGSLKVAQCSTLTPEGLQSITRMPRLRELDLRGVAVDAAIENLPSRLRSLRLANSMQLTDAGVATLLRRCPELVELDLDLCPKVTVIGVREVVGHGRWRSLRCKGIELDDAVAEQICSLRLLTTLSLGGSWLNDRHVQRLAAVPEFAVRMRDLTLNGTAALTDRGLRALGPLRVLRRLDLYQCTGITLDGVRALAPLPLTWLSVYETEIPEPAVDDFVAGQWPEAFFITPKGYRRNDR